MRAHPRARRSGAALALALPLAALGACNRVEPVEERAIEEDPVALARQIDTWVEEDLAEPDGYAEARAWLREDRNVLFEGDKDAVRALVDELYADGAERVWVTGIEAFGGMRVSASIALSLPEDRQARTALFERYRSFYAGTADDPTHDVGQRYLTFAFD